MNRFVKKHIRVHVLMLAGLLLAQFILAKNLHKRASLKTVFKDAFSEFVVDTKLLKFNENLANAYNPSILEQENGYLLVFRHDSSVELCSVCKYCRPEIKLVSLDKNFEQITPVKTLKVSSDCPEDARLHILNKQFFLTYNNAFGPHKHNQIRQLFFGKLDVDLGLVSDIKQLTSKDIRLTPVEKNWPPFEYPEDSGSLHYVYETSPFTIIKVDDLENGIAMKMPSVVSPAVDKIWKKSMYGGIKGGTPARLIDGVYLSFFHSWTYVKKQKAYYYFMGAYIFQPGPPFKLLAMTSKPIFFKNIYSAPHRLSSLNSIYPAGFAIERREGNDLLHVSCGENDTSIRIVTIEKSVLFKSMVVLS